MTITEFLLARIAEDEAGAFPFRNELGEVKAWQADEIGGVVRYVGPMAFSLPDRLATFDTHLEAEHVGRWHPARVLAECAAKRAIVELVDNYDGDDWGLPLKLPEVLAAVYKDHPDYLPEWAL